jgi:heptosyltransferase III
MTRSKEVNISSVNKILVCMFKYQGDVLLIAPFLQALKNHIPHALIDCFIFDNTREMLEGHSAINKIITYEKKQSFIKRSLYDVKKAYRLRLERYDLAFNMSQGDRGALFCLASGANTRVGFESLGMGFLLKDKVFSHLVAKTAPTRHIIDINLDPLRMIGINPSSSHDKELYLHIDDKSNEQVDELLAMLDLKKQEYLVCHPGSRCSFKHWPNIKWAQLIEKLQARGIKLVLTGGPGIEQKKVVEDILSQLKSHDGVYNVCGKTSLKELAALIDKSMALITIDSVPLHISSALKKPVVAIFGPSIELKWGPYQNQNTRIVTMPMSCRSCDLEGCANSGRSECLETLPVERVYKAIESLLECKAFS